MDLAPLVEACINVLSHHVSDSLGKSKKCCAVVIDPKLNSLLFNASPSSSVFLRAGATREFGLSTEELDWKDDGPVMFVLRPSPHACRLVAQQMRALIRSRARPDFRAVFIPRRSFRCEETLKEEGVLTWFTQGLHAVSLGFVPVEDDVISLELDDFIRETKIDGDTSSYAFAARALLDFGPIKNIRSKGHTSKEVLDLYLRMNREHAESSSSPHPSSSTTSKSKVDVGDMDSEEAASSVSSQQGGQDPFDDDQAEEDLDDDENVRLATKIGGPLDVFGGFPRLGKRRSTSAAGAGVDTLILIDREVDMVSPLCTPLTYESLLDENFGGLKSGFLNIKSSVLRLDDAVVAQEDEFSPSSSSMMQLSFRGDTLFSEIRDVSVTSVMRMLNEKAKELKETQDRMHRTRDVQDLQEFVQRLPELQQIKKRLTTHIALAQRVSAFAGDRKFRATWHAERAAVNGDGRPLLERAQDCAARGDALTKVLRLLCLNCILTGGFSSQKLDEVRQDLIHAYGYDIMFTLDNLEKLGMLSQKPFHPQHKLSANLLADSQAVGGQGLGATGGCIFSNWPLVKKTFRLLVEDDDAGIDDGIPKDCSYVFSGFAPLSVRLVQMDIAPGGWAGKVDLLRVLDNGPTICDVKPPSAMHGKHSSSSLPRPALAGITGKSLTKKRVMVVFYLGGVSHAEISALRFVAAQPDCPFKIIVATTSVVNGNTLIRSLYHPVAAAGETTSVSSGANPFG